MMGATDIDALLVAAATDLIDRANDDQNHTVAAAIRTHDGTVFTGVNLFHFTGGPCAELVALANAAASGGGVETIVAVGSNGRGVIAPCGRCRQVIADYWPNVTVLMPGSSNETTIPTPITELLPGRYVLPIADAEPG